MLDIICWYFCCVNGIVENVFDLFCCGVVNIDLIDVGIWFEEFKVDYLQIQDYVIDFVIQLSVENNIFQVCFDISQIEQVMVNLCDNGLRYSEQ